MAHISLLYPGAAAADVVVAEDPADADFGSVTEGGSTRLTYTDIDLAGRISIGDTVTIDIDGTEHEVTVRNRNLVTGAITFEESTPTAATIAAGTSVTLSTDAGSTPAERIFRYTSDTDTTGEATKVVYLTETAYEAITTPDPNTLYLIRD